MPHTRTYPPQSAGFSDLPDAPSRVPGSGLPGAPAAGCRIEVEIESTTHDGPAPRNVLGAPPREQVSANICATRPAVATRQA